jgi:hypothetical protein
MSIKKSKISFFFFFFFLLFLIFNSDVRVRMHGRPRCIRAPELPVGCITDIPQEILTKVAERIEKRQDFTSFSLASRAARSACESAFVDTGRIDLGLSGHHVMDLEMVLGTRRASRLLQILSEMQKADPLPTSPNPLQIMWMYTTKLHRDTYYDPGVGPVQRAPSNKQEFLDHRVRQTRLSNLDRQELAANYGELFSMINQNVSFPYRMRLEFMNDARFVRFLWLMFHRPSQAIEKLDPTFLFIVWVDFLTFFPPRQDPFPVFIHAICEHQMRRNDEYYCKMNLNGRRLIPVIPIAHIMLPLLRKALDLEIKGHEHIVRYLERYLPRSLDLKYGEDYGKDYGSISIRRVLVEGINHHHYKFPNDPNMAALMETTLCQILRGQPLPLGHDDWIRMRIEDVSDF